ncbi:MAG: hypothetical protein AAGH15_28160 [Myxococcota bacterium]
MLAGCGQSRTSQLELFERESRRLAEAECACGFAPVDASCAGLRQLGTSFDEGCLAEGFPSDMSATTRLGCEISVLGSLADCFEADCGCDDASLRDLLVGCDFRGAEFEGAFWGSYLACYAGTASSCPNGAALTLDGPANAGPLDQVGDGLAPGCGVAPGLPERTHPVAVPAGRYRIEVAPPAGPGLGRALAISVRDGCEGAELACGGAEGLEVEVSGPFVVAVEGHVRDGYTLTLAAL